MSYARLSSVRGGAALTLPQQIALAAHGDLPLKVFRRVYYLRFQTSGAARLRLLEATSLGLRFEEKQHDALASGAPDGAGVRSDAGGGFVRVELPVPRRVRRVNLSGSRFFAEQAASAVVSNGAASRVANGFEAGIGSDFGVTTVDGLQLVLASPIALHRVDGDAVADEATTTGNAGSTLADPFVAASFAVRSLDATALTPAKLASIVVGAFPTGARAGVAPLDGNGALVEPPLFFWREAGEIDDASGRLPIAADAGPALRDTLQRMLDAALAEGAAESVDIALVVESDAPCAATLTQLEVPYLLARDAFTAPPGGAVKETLRFDGAQAQTQRLSMQLPGGAVVHGASLRVEEALGGPELAAFGDDPTGALALATGAHLAPSHWVAQPLTPPAPIQVSAIALAILPLARDTELAVELREDWRGGPGGAVLVAQKLLAGVPGRGGWLRATLDAPFVLDNVQYWMRVRPTRGSAVWLAHGDIEIVEDAQAAADDGAVRVVRSGTTLLALSSALASASAPSARLALAGAALEPAAADAGSAQTYDLVATLLPLVASGAAGTTMTLELAFTTSRRGVVTVYPPAIEYEIAG